MRPFLYSFFHRETNDRSEKGMVNIPEDRNQWPEAWKQVEYKKRLFFPAIPLPVQSGSFKDLARERVTKRGVVGGTPLTIADLSYILECGTGKRGVGIERYAPSGGSRYPLESYIILFRSVEALEPGVYHYLVENHQLELLRIHQFSPEEIDTYSPYKWLNKANGMICLTAVFHRSVQKYGSRAYRYILLEAGHVAQNMLLASTERKKTMIPIGGVNEKFVESFIGLSSSKEKIIYTLYI